MYTSRGFPEKYSQQNVCECVCMSVCVCVCVCVCLYRHIQASQVVLLVMQEITPMQET